MNMPIVRESSKDQMLSVVTAIHNQLPYNQLYFDSLCRYTHNPYELIIINNCCTDGSADFFRANGAYVIDNTENVPYSRAQNQGFAASSGKYVAFLNNDILLSPEWDKRLIACMEDYGIDIICPAGNENMETDAATRRAMRRWRYINFLQRFRMNAGIAYDEKSLRALIELMYGDWEAFCRKRESMFRRFMYSGISGYAVVARRAIFDKIGAWNENVAAADADLALRLAKRQIEHSDARGVMVAGDVFVHHFIRATFRSQRRSGGTPWNKLNSIEQCYNADDLRYLNRPAASVIIAVYNHADFLEKVLESLLAQTRSDFEVVIADDGSGPEIAEVAGRYSGRFLYPVQHVRHEHDGFRKTIIANRAVAASRGNCLIFIDGDCIVHSRFIERHLKRSRLHAVLTGRRVKLDKELSATLSLDDIRDRRLEKAALWRGRCDRRTAKYGTFRPHMFDMRNLLGGSCGILGCNFSVHKGDYYRINGYEEKIIGRGLEDNNLSNRFAAAKMKILNIAYEAIEYHLHHEYDPIPHNKEFIEAMGTNVTAWTDTGICRVRSAVEDRKERNIP